MENNIKVRDDIWNSVSGLSDEQLNTVVEEGKWSIAQVLEHLFLVEKNVARGIRKVIPSNEINLAKQRDIHLFIDRSTKFVAPKFVAPSNKFQTVEQLKEKLASSRQALVDSIQGASEGELNQKSLPHPVYGALTISQWVPFIGYHEQRHLLQIEEIKVALGKQTDL